MNHTSCFWGFIASLSDEDADSRCHAAVSADKKLQVTHHAAPNACEGLRFDEI